MKKLLSLLLALYLCMNLCANALCDGYASDATAQKLLDAFAEKRWEGYVISEVTVRDVPLGDGSLACAYDPSYNIGAAVISNGKVNMLCLFSAGSNGKLRVTDASDKAVLQGSSIPQVSIARGHIIVSYLDAQGRSLGLSYDFRKRDSQWILNFLSYPDEATGKTVVIEVYDDRLEFSDGSWSDIRTAYGVYGRKFEQFNVNSFPYTYKEACYKLTLAPKIPESDSVWGIHEPREIAFASNKQYPVYTGPGESYLRGADGKAVMSTNDWVQVFGTEGDWALVQYDISSEQMRIGYISASGLPEKAAVPGLHFAFYPATLTACDITDDPLCSQKPLRSLSSSTPVTFLGWLGNDWAYVEVSTGGTFLRGFVPADALIITYPDENAIG